MKIIHEESAEMKETFDEVIASCGMRNANQNGDFEKAKFYKKLYTEGPMNNEKIQVSAERMVYLR